MSALAKLMEARKEFHRRELKKTGWNDFSKFKYLELADFLIPAMEIFDTLKLGALTSFTRELATMTITDLEDNSSVVITSPFGSAALKACHEVQNIGAVETYQRRYLWVAALEIVEHDALDAAVGADKPKSAKSVPQDELDKQDADTRAWLEEIAGNVRSLITRQDVSGAYDEIESHNLAIELKTALWALLDSKERSAIKKESDQRKQKAA